MLRKIGNNSYALEGGRVWSMIKRGIYSVAICSACHQAFAYNNRKKKRKTCCKACSRAYRRSKRGSTVERKPGSQ